MNFDHVVNEAIRNVLVHGPKKPAELEQAITESNAYFEEDLKDDSISFNVLQSRNWAINAAQSAFNNGKKTKALSELRKYWSI